MGHTIDNPENAYGHLRRFERIGVDEGMKGNQLLAEISLHGPKLLEIAVEGLRRDLQAIKKAQENIDRETGQDIWAGWV